MAKSISCLYENREQLATFVDVNELHEYPNLLLQVFSGDTSVENIQKLQTVLKDLLPNATIIGCTTDGEIFEGKIYKGQILLSFTIFEKTTLTAILRKRSEFPSCKELGKHSSKDLIKYGTKVIITFPTSLNIDPQLVIEGIYEENQEVLIVGGLAGDNGEYKETLVFNSDEITSNGIVAVALHNEELIIHKGIQYEWQEVGKPFTITKANNKIIYSIDNLKPLQVLRQYLGDSFINDLPKRGAEFPFIIERNGEKFSVFMLKVLKNGALEVNRRVEEGEQVSFAYVNLNLLIQHSISDIKKLVKQNVETVFVYNCMARRRYVNHYTQSELEMINRIAPANGFFTYGEVAHNNQTVPQVIGHALTYLAISENSKPTIDKKVPIKYEIPDEMKTIVSLTHLMEAASNDIRTLNETISVSEQYYQSLFNNNTDFVYSTDMKGNFTTINPAFKETFGYDEGEIIGRSALKYIKSEDIARVRMHFYRALKGKEQYYNLEIPSKDGHVQLFQIKNIPITVNGERVGIYGIGRNITDQKKTEEKMIQLAYFDVDTGLPNRAKFTEILQEKLKLAIKKKRQLAVIFMDLDRFKIVNDSLGHYAGDEVLKQLVERIRLGLPSGSFLGRFGGDKFTLLLTKDVQMSEVAKTTRQILETISEPILFDNQEFFVTASLGVSMFPDDGLDEQSLLKNADTAMNRSKNHGGNRNTFYCVEMNDQAKARLELESFLRKALLKNEFYLCYQPLIDLETGIVYGSEALIRWAHPKLGLVSPADFIPLAEETGLINEIGRWVLRTACFQTSKWQEMGLGSLSISVNVSANQFQQLHFIDDVKQALLDSGLQPRYLNLELTESVMLRNVQYSVATMKALQDMGVNVSIDDFGTGYSSLSYLRNLPINTLKIDRSFINNLGEGTSDVAIVQAIITMGYGLGVKVVAEGVETKEQIELLKNLKCHYAQGFYIHKPLSSNDFENDLKIRILS